MTERLNNNKGEKKREQSQYGDICIITHCRVLDPVSDACHAAGAD